MTLVPLTKGKFAVIDDADATAVLAHKWHVTGHERRWYAARGCPKRIYLHNVLLPLALPLTVDHINGDGLDNRRVTLRPATKSQQQWNRKASRRGFKGVTWSSEPGSRLTAGGRWKAHICVHGRRITRWGAKTEREAAALYNELAREHYGEYARLNDLGEAS